MKSSPAQSVQKTEDFFQFTWANKSTATNEAVSTTIKKLIPNSTDSIGFKTSKNIFIEGENLDALKLLLPEFKSAVKLIYIDPPYNTGNPNFAYKDTFKQSKSKSKNNQNEDIGANQFNMAQYHSDWLSMMYSRLLLAKEFLKEDGVMLISIDDSELAYLKIICDEIFGMQHFIGNFIWHNRTTPNDAGLKFATDHEYIVAYAKDKSKVQFIGIDKDLSKYKNPDYDPKGAWIADNPSAASGNETYRFPIENPYTGQVYFPPKGRYWAFAPKRVAEWHASGKIVFPKETGKNFLLKKYVTELKSDKKPISSIIQGILTSFGTKELKALFEDACPFKYPKPTQLIKIFVQQLSSNEDIVMDFFAGSGTTAQATMDANMEDAQQRRFICVQKPEPFSSKDEDLNKQYKTVSNVTKQRIHKVIEKHLQNLQIKKHPLLSVQCFTIQ